MFFRSIDGPVVGGEAQERKTGEAANRHQRKERRARRYLRGEEEPSPCPSGVPERVEKRNV